ncbi:hypothetical protein Sste5346_005059 [Sporothrix stenoceras]|uniref:Uncharacterized protein n=1 Tax=Sporothrix stenoceras TaxID=5173 RepID=A0ABR3Z676_9PEZI
MAAVLSAHREWHHITDVVNEDVIRDLEAQGRTEMAAAAQDFLRVIREAQDPEVYADPHAHLRALCAALAKAGVRTREVVVAVVSWPFAAVWRAVVWCWAWCWGRCCGGKEKKEDEEEQELLGGEAV